MEDVEVQAKLAQVIARAWSDPAFKLKLKNNPWEALREMGIDPKPNIKLTVVEDSDSEWYLYLPPAPDFNKAGIQTLKPMSPGGSSSSGQCCKPVPTL